MFKEIKTIVSPTNQLRSLVLLNDNTIALCSIGYSIWIYAPFSDYSCKEEKSSKSIYSLLQLTDNTIVSFSYMTLSLGAFEIENDYTDNIAKLVELPDNRIAACSISNDIFIWKSTPPYSSFPIKVLQGHSKFLLTILYIKERGLLASVALDKTLRLWNMKTYQCVNVIGGVNCYCSNSFEEGDKDRVIIGHRDGFSVINIDKCRIGIIRFYVGVIKEYYAYIIRIL